jgi:hypothetical protein
MGLRRGWSSYNNHLTFRHKDEICRKTRISVYKQHSRIRSRFIGTSQSKSNGNPKIGNQNRFTNCRDQEKHFEGFTVKNISRNDNSDIDELAKAAAQNSSLPQDVFYQILKQASIKAVQATPEKSI